MILWPDGFGHYGTDRTKMDQYATVGAAWAPSAANPRTGIYSLKYTASPGNNTLITAAHVVRRSFPSAQTSVKLGYAFWIDKFPGMETDFNGFASIIMACFLDATGHTQVHIVMGTDGSIAAYGDYGWAGSAGLGDLLGRSDPGVLHVQAWNHFEILTNIDETSGTIEVRIDGVTRLSLTNVNTDPAGSGDTTQVLLAGGSPLNGVLAWYIADMIASNTTGTNADFLGDQQVFTDFPNADTVSEDWVPSAGTTLYGVVDEPVPDDAGTYAEAQNAGDIMGLNFPALPGTVVEVLDVTLFHRTKKTGPGASTIQSSIDSNGSATLGEDRPMVTVYQGWLDNYEVDPDTLAPWLPAAAGAATAFFERTA